MNEQDLKLVRQHRQNSKQPDHIRFIISEPDDKRVRVKVLTEEEKARAKKLSDAKERINQPEDYGTCEVWDE